MFGKGEKIRYKQGAAARGDEDEESSSDGGSSDESGSGSSDESSSDDGAPRLLTYAAAGGAHGPSGTLSWRRARYTLLDGGEEVASCECEVTFTRDGAQKRLVFGGDITVVVDELAATAHNSGTGHALWPGAVALALWVIGRENAARTVVELGCGACALPGRAAAALGGTVTLTDGAPALLPVLPNEYDADYDDDAAFARATKRGPGGPR